MKNITIVSTNLAEGQYTFTVNSDNNPYGSNVYGYPYPTSNCQVSSIGCVHRILEKLQDNDAASQAIADICAAMGLVNRQVLIDVKGIYGKRIREIFKDRIVFDSPYVSTNGSNMVMFLVKTKKL